MKVIAKIRFRDLEKDVIREIGEEWEVTKARADKLVELNFVNAVKPKPTAKKERE